MGKINEIPIIQQALFLLQEACSVNGIKITETGSLGRNFVQAFWDKFVKKSEKDMPFRPTRELECPEATRIHFLLSEYKYIRKFKGKITITEKGKAVLNGGVFDALYFDLLNCAIQSWDWGYEDRYPGYHFIQQSAQQLIERLLTTSSVTVTALQIFDDIFAKETRGIDQKLKHELCQCLLIRFLYRFCVPFGILKADKDDFFPDKKVDDLFEKTEFFMSQFPKIISEQAKQKIDNQVSSKNKLDTTLGFTPAAQKFWDALDPKNRVRLINNAFCASCKAETGIGNVSGSIDSGDLVLRGICTKCSEPVARLIERT